LADEVISSPAWTGEDQPYPARLSKRLRRSVEYDGGVAVLVLQELRNPVEHVLPCLRIFVGNGLRMTYEIVAIDKVHRLGALIGFRC
jgi:hypothetical protein